ncbi:hypothetical protein ACSSNL_07460 [Thalassobius sp. S69A]|uniref:hypothetical protein n=1 Tax=unclassified Thalassovita TaxID=2619711 RepID=UPI000C6B210B|nr:hypothetical protein [Paracoccaceae bacterium]
MPFLLGLIIVFILVMVFSNRATRHCRWRANRRADQPGQAAYTCVTCGAHAFTADGHPPRQCHAETPPPSL